MRIEVFGKTWTLTCKMPVKVTCFIKIWNDPTVNTVILLQPVWLETPIEVQIFTKMLKVIFSKVWGSSLRQYSIIWRNSCGNFDENSIRTRLAWSLEHRHWKNHKFILDSCGSGARRQRRQPVNRLRSLRFPQGTQCLQRSHLTLIVKIVSMDRPEN